MVTCSSLEPTRNEAVKKVENKKTNAIHGYNWSHLDQRGARLTQLFPTIEVLVIVKRIRKLTQLVNYELQSQHPERYE